MTIRLLLLSLFLAMLGFGLRLRVSAADPLQAELQKALADQVNRVEVSARLPGPTTTKDGQYVLHLKTTPEREVGLVAYKQEFALDKAPFFWINLTGDIDKHEPTQVVLLPTDTGMKRDEIPDDWIMSDYLTTRKPTRTPSFLALNPRRKLTKLDEAGTKWVAETGFVTVHPISPNQLSRTYFFVDPTSKKLKAYAFMLHRLKDEAEGEQLMKSLETLLN